MLVPVNWSNNHYDYVSDTALDKFIEAGVVIRFLRGSGWVIVGVDPIRLYPQMGDYRGIERRSKSISSVPGQ